MIDPKLIADVVRHSILRCEFESAGRAARQAALALAEAAVAAELGHAPADLREVIAVVEHAVFLLMHPGSKELAPRARRALEEADYTECFGHCRHDEICDSCEYRESCDTVARTELAVNCSSGFVSWEKIEGWYEDLATTENPAVYEENHVLPPELEALQRFCHYILGLDDYTLGILAKIISPRAELKDFTVAELARFHRSSRQAMHRKMLASVRKHPELASVFSCALRKIGRCRAQFKTTYQTEVIK